MGLTVNGAVNRQNVHTIETLIQKMSASKCKLYSLEDLHRHVDSPQTRDSASWPNG